MLGETASTNADAMRYAQLGEPGGLWVVAERQTAGRGRSGRSWTSLPGNFHASLMLRDLFPLEHTYQLALVAGVACHDAVRNVLSLPRPAPISADLQIKWPNDLLIGRRKLAGILVEGSTQSTGNVAVIGIGLNLAARPEGDDAISLADFGAAITPSEMLAFLAPTMQEWLGIWNVGRGFAEVRGAWLARGTPRGTELSVHATEGVRSGRFAGLSEAGSLVIEFGDGSRGTYTYGDVTLPG
ncbi:MAG: biotin--[acetyl-CoA-carboxylase] ligase [Hyphomicrobium sp.]|nr:biotin--[acetyl-CoA-carboxylase] ligase [Hyphomicrobium sp.]